MKYIVGLLCATVFAGIHSVPVTPPLASVRGNLPVTAVENCTNYQGVWEQTHFSSSNAINTTMKEATDTIKLVMTKVESDCSFEATFNGDKVKHSIRGKMVKSQEKSRW